LKYKRKRRNLGNRDWEGRIWGFGYWVWKSDDWWYQSCRNKCIFCFIDQLPKEWERLLF